MSEFACTPTSGNSALDYFSDVEIGGESSIPDILENTPEAIARRAARRNLKIRLMSRDKQLLKVNYTFLECSETLVSMIDCLDINQNNAVEDALDVPMVHSDTLRRIFQWARFHKNASPATDKKMIEKYNAKFLDINKQTLVEMLMAAFFLKIEALKVIICQKIGESQLVPFEKAFKKLNKTN